MTLDFVLVFNINIYIRPFISLVAYRFCFALFWVSIGFG